jgi:hypothetical protein
MKLFLSIEKSKICISFNEIRNLLESIFTYLIDKKHFDAHFLNNHNLPNLGNIIHYLKGHSINNDTRTIIWNKEKIRLDKISENELYCLEFVKNLTGNNSHSKNEFEEATHLLISCAYSIIVVLYWAIKFDRNIDK